MSDIRKTYRSTLDPNGAEIFSGEVQVLPVHLARGRSISEQIRDMILSMQQVQVDGYETFEDADDFDIEDEETSSFDSPYERDFDHLPDVTPPPQASSPESSSTAPEPAAAPAQKTNDS